MAPVLNKSWIKSKKIVTREYIAGILEFIDFAKDHVDINGEIYCPCNHCYNNRKWHINVVRADLFKHGFWSSYEVWTKHGEEEVIPVNDPIVDSEMLNVLDDLRPTIELGGHSGDTEMGDENLNGQGRGCFDVLFKEMEKELYPGCTVMGSLDFIAKLMHVKVKNKWTNTSFTELLELLARVLPKGHTLPDSYAECDRKLKSLGMGYITIDVCLNDCALYYKENGKLEKCPVCGESRWDPKKGKKVPHKKLRYFPIAPRLQRMYASRHTAEDMIWHHTGKSTDEDVLRHPVDGTSWKTFDEKNPEFASEPRNVRLGLGIDGFCPFSMQNNSYSMWPVILTIYNLPPWLCMKESTFMLTLLIPGPRSPGKDMDVFLRPIIDELEMLWGTGIVTYDAHMKEEFVMKVSLLFTTNDYPARSYTSGWSGQGYLACPECMEYTPSVRVNKGVVYFDHRRWLPLNHRFRKNTSLYKKDDDRPPPRKHSPADIQTQLDGLPIVFPGKHKDFGGKVAKKIGPREFNWKKKSIFYRLPYWSENLLKHNIDVMHCEKNVCDALLGTVVGLDGKINKDNVKARKDLEDMDIRQDLWLFEDSDGKTIQPRAKYAITTDKRRVFLDWLKVQKFPDGFASNLRNNVQSDLGKIIGMKSHDCHILMQFLFVASLPGLINDKSISDPIIGLCNVFRNVCKKNLSKKELESGKTEVVELMCKLEMIFPPAFFDIMIHLVVHLYEEAQLGGPVQMRWMYPFERYLKKLKEYIRNPARPEGSIAEGYVVEETLTFISRYLEEESTKFNKPCRHGETVVEPREISVFKSQCKPIGKKEYGNLPFKEKEHIDWYILLNCDEIQSYMMEHKSTLPLLDIDTKHREKFRRWFMTKVFLMHEAGDPLATDELVSLSNMSNGPVYSYNSCVVNGVKWVTRDKGERRVTQDYGVCTITGGETFYGELVKIVEVEFISGCSVVLFKCKWYNTDEKMKKRKSENGATMINTNSFYWSEEPYILATQAKKVFYIDEINARKTQKVWKVVWEVNDRHGYSPELWGAESISTGPEAIPIPLVDTNLDSEYPLIQLTTGQGIEIDFSMFNLVPENLMEVDDEEHDETLFEYETDEETTYIDSDDDNIIVDDGYETD